MMSNNFMIHQRLCYLLYISSCHLQLMIVDSFILLSCIENILFFNSCILNSSSSLHPFFLLWPCSGNIKRKILLVNKRIVCPLYHVYRTSCLGSFLFFSPFAQFLYGMVLFVSHFNNVVHTYALLSNYCPKYLSIFLCGIENRNISNLRSRRVTLLMFKFCMKELFRIFQFQVISGLNILAIWIDP
jgi:hypothetical protein